MHRRAIALCSALALALTLLPAFAGADDTDVNQSENVERLAHLMTEGGATEIDYDGSRYAYAGQWNGTNPGFDRQNVQPGQPGGLWIIDLVGDDDTEQFSVVGKLECPGTDNYVRYIDPDVIGDGREYVAMAHHGNLCSKAGSGEHSLQRDPHTASSYGGFNGVTIIDVTDKANPTIASTIGHYSAHTVMPHPTRPYLYVLPGGLANGTSTQRISPTGIIDISDPHSPRYVTAFEHNATGCHDLGFTPDGDYAYCAGLVEVQVWDVSGEAIESPVVVNTITNPAIMFPHNAVVSDDGKYMLINDEAFGFHTCTGQAADLYGSLWIYDISIPDVPVLAGRISPPDTPNDVGSYSGWVDSWCAAHNYNFVPGTHVVVASWFTGGMTAHDISNPLAPEKIAHYMPEGGVAWSAHYYGGFVLTGDMARGVEILDVPDLRDAEAAAAADQVQSASTSLSLTGSALGAPRVDLTDLLVPDALPARPVRPEYAAYQGGGGFCVLPRTGGPSGPEAGSLTGSAVDA